MEVPPLPPSPVRDVYGRMRRLSDAIDDPDSSIGQRVAWTDEYVGLSGELRGLVGARTAAGIEVLDRATRATQVSDGQAPRVRGSDSRRTDLWL